MTMILLRTTFISTLAAGFAAPALAHPGHGALGFGDGFSHALLGFDHLLAMLAVGILAAQRMGPSLFAYPAAFMIMMAVGILSGQIVQTAVPATAFVCLAGTGAVLLVALVGFKRHVGFCPLLAIVGVCALCHGWSHGIDLPDNTHGPQYLTGLMAASAALHLSGAVVMVALRSLWNTADRYAAAARR